MLQTTYPDRMLRRLQADGFGRSSVGAPVNLQGADVATVHVACDSCEALVINGVACHEAGCRRQTFECRGCDATVSRRGAYCPECR
jgi:hypothetical protein